MSHPNAVVFGAGKMACGLLGQLLARSGYHTLFVARRPEVIDAVNHHHGYSLEITGSQPHRLTVRNCSARSIRDQSQVADAVSYADAVFTAVGIDNLASITPVIAEGLWRRSHARGDNPLNVIACENLPGAGAYLRHQVVSAAPLDHHIEVERVGGFSAALTRRIMTGGAVEDGELSFTVDADYDLVIDTEGLKGAFPAVHGAALTEDFPAMVLRKLFLLNCAHAVSSYLGYREGCRYVHEAVAHPRVAPVLRGAVAESQAALKAEFPHMAQDIERDAAQALERIANPSLADAISRVARGPRRKLSSRERLVGPARLAIKHGLPCENLHLAIAAALTYDDPSDPQAVAMQETIAAEGVEKVLTEDCGLLPHEYLARAVKQKWAALVPAGARNGAASNRLLGQAGTSVEEIVEAVTRELSRSYDPILVKEVVTRTAQEFRNARVRAYVPIFVKREAAQHLAAGAAA